MVEAANHPPAGDREPSLELKHPVIQTHAYHGGMGIRTWYTQTVCERVCMNNAVRRAVLGVVSAITKPLLFPRFTNTNH